jgi:tetratricopeptide (TPR) repeat protein
MAFSPDGLTLASGSGVQDTQQRWSGEVRLWDAKTGQHKLTLSGGTDIVSSVAFSRDGQRVFAWNNDGNVRAWAVANGQPIEPINPPPRPSFGPVVSSPDGSRLAEPRSYGIVLTDIAREREERLALEPVNRAWWHQQYAALAAENNNWFAAAFHLRQLRRDRPDDTSLIRRHEQALLKLGRWDVTAAHLAEARRFSANPSLSFQLAVAQVSVGDEAEYRRTCQDLLRRSGREADAALAACLLAGTIPENAGGLALAALLITSPPPLQRIRYATVQVCLLKPDGAEVLERILPLAQSAHPLYYGAALCRLKRHDEAAAQLQQVQQQYPLARLYLALAEAGRGNLDQARQARDRAGKSAPTQWPWESQQEFELLRREVEDLLTPRMDKLPPP